MSTMHITLTLTISVRKQIISIMAGFNKTHTTLVFLLIATAFTGVVAVKGPKGVGAQTATSQSSLRRLDKVKKGPTKRDCKLCKSQLICQITFVSLRNFYR
jgi:hypothetical protein